MSLRKNRSTRHHFVFASELLWELIDWLTEEHVLQITVHTLRASLVKHSLTRVDTNYIICLGDASFHEFLTNHARSASEIDDLAVDGAVLGNK